MCFFACNWKYYIIGFLYYSYLSDRGKGGWLDHFQPSRAECKRWSSRTVVQLLKLFKNLFFKCVVSAQFTSQCIMGARSVRRQRSVGEDEAENCLLWQHRTESVLSGVLGGVNAAHVHLGVTETPFSPRSPRTGPANSSRLSCNSLSWCLFFGYAPIWICVKIALSCAMMKPENVGAH